MYFFRLSQKQFGSPYVMNSLYEVLPTQLRTYTHNCSKGSFVAACCLPKPQRRFIGLFAWPVHAEPPLLRHIKIIT